MAAVRLMTYKPGDNASAGMTNTEVVLRKADARLVNGVGMAVEAAVASNRVATWVSVSTLAETRSAHAVAAMVQLFAQPVTQGVGSLVVVLMSIHDQANVQHWSAGVCVKTEFQLAV